MSDIELTGRHCFNPSCDGPEWWAFYDEATDTYRNCPSCEYPCSIGIVPQDEMSADAICRGLWMAKEPK